MIEMKGCATVWFLFVLSIDPSVSSTEYQYIGDSHYATKQFLVDGQYNLTFIRVPNFVQNDFYDTRCATNCLIIYLRIVKK